MENEKEETQQTQGTQGTQETPETLEAIKAELDEARQARTAAEAAVAQKDALIGDLQAQLSEVKQASEAAAAEITEVKEAHGQAVSKYLEAVKLANPTMPGDVITGDTIEAIDASLAKATTIAGAVKAGLEAEAKQAKVPAGAPARSEISLDGLSPREKIAAGIQQKGGTQ
jgi:hypothetical protein